MSSVFGKIFQISTWGESHGKGLGVVIDGCPAGLSLSEDDIQAELDKRKPGQSKLTTSRKEGDVVEIMSGVFEGKTTGTPISLVIVNQDQRSHDYGNIDYRGGGRSSARETAARVAAGAIAKKLLLDLEGIEFLAWVCQVGTISAQVPDILKVRAEDVESHPTRCPDREAALQMEQAILVAKKSQDSIGGVVQFVVKNVPAGLGEPIFDRLEANLARAMLSIPATKGFEIGSGFEGTKLRGSEHNDAIFHSEEKGFYTKTNRAGGTLGGISNGMPIWGRVAFKPTATISKDQDTVHKEGEASKLTAKGRHDPCVVPRAPVIVETMAALTLVDFYLEQRARGHMFK
jgi:chorismate synthase